MTSSAMIARVLDPLIDPAMADQDLLMEKAFRNQEDQVKRGYVHGFKRVVVEDLDWAGDKLLLAGRDGVLRLWDPERGEKERSWPGEWMAVHTDPNSPFQAAAISWEGRFRMFDTRSSGTCAWDLDLKKTSPHMTKFLNVQWSPNSKYVALSNQSDHVYVLDVAGGLRLRGAKHANNEVNDICWAPDGEHIWLAQASGRIQVLPAPTLDEKEGGKIFDLAAHQTGASCLAADPTGRQIACGGGDCLTTLWDPQQLVCTSSMGYATQGVTTLGFNHTGRLLAWGTGSRSGSERGGGEKNLTIVGADTKSLYWQDPTQAPVQNVRWHRTRNILAYTLMASALPDDKDAQRDRRLSGKDFAVVHTLRVPEVA